MLEKDVDISVTETFRNKSQSGIKRYSQSTLKSQSDKVQTAEFSPDGKTIALASGNGNTLYAASVRGDDQIVKMLLEKGADVNAQRGEYGNALQAASAGGYDKVVQILLNKGADVNAQAGGFCGNALQAASLRGYDKVVQILLE